MKNNLDNMIDKKTKGEVETPLVKKSPEAGLSEKKFIETYGDKFKVNLFDKDGNFIFVQTYFGGKDKPVVIFDGSKGKTERKTLEELDEKLKVYIYKEKPKEQNNLSREPADDLDKETKEKLKRKAKFGSGSEKEMDEYESGSKTFYKDGKNTAYTDNYSPDDARDEEHRIIGAEIYEKREQESKNQEGIPAVGKENIIEEDESIIEKLEKEVEDKRDKYAAAEYKATSVFSKVSKALPFLKTKLGDIPEVRGIYTDYRISLNMLLDHKLKNLKAAGLSGETLKNEMGNLVNYFKVEEKRKLFETHTNSRAKYVEEKFGDKPGKIMELSSRFINWHRKQAGWKKSMSGIGFGMIGLGFVGRTAGALSAGVGVKEFMEGRYRKGEAKEEIEEKERILKEMETDEQNFEKLFNFLEKDINASDKKLKKEKREALKRTLAGAGVGFIIGSGTMAELTRWGFGHIAEYLGISGEDLGGAKPKISDAISDNQADLKGTIQPETGYFEANPSTGAPFGAETGGEPATPNSSSPLMDNSVINEAVSDISAPLEIKGGSNLWQTLQENGSSNQEISAMLNDYAEKNGLDIKSLDEMYPGQKIILSPDGKSIEKILESHDSHLMKSIKEISKDKISNWREVKGLSFDQVEKPSLTKSLAKVMEKYHDILGDSANPKKGEEIQKWVARMAKLAINKQ